MQEDKVQKGARNIYFPAETGSGQVRTPDETSVLKWSPTASKPLQAFHRGSPRVLAPLESFHFLPTLTLG